jgi:hypothetical protein
VEVTPPTSLGSPRSVAEDGGASFGASGMVEAVPTPVPTERARWLVAVLIGLACGVASRVATTLPGFGQQDFSAWWLAARAVLHGQNPYTTVIGASGLPAYYHPLPTALATIPFAWMPERVAGPIFAGGSCALLAFAITARAWWPLLIFLSGSLVSSVIVAQFSPLLVAAMLLPSLTWLGVLKPNIGLAMLAHRPSWKAAVTMIVIAGASLAVRPSWPREWIDTTRQSPFYFAPWRVMGGALVLLAVTRWRRPEARLLTVLALVPSAPIVYEALPLFLIPRTKLQMITLALLSDVMYLAMANLSAQHETIAYYARARLAIVWLLYVPALIMVLRRPNEGEVPTWVDQLTRRLRIKRS